MPAAYVLIHLNMSVDFSDSLRDIRAVEGVKRADLVVGPDDCIAYVESTEHHTNDEYHPRHTKRQWRRQD